MQHFRTIPITLAIAAAPFISAQTPTTNALPIPQQVGASKAVEPQIVDVEKNPAKRAISLAETGDLNPTEVEFVQDATEDARRIVQLAELARTRSADTKAASLAEKLVSRNAKLMRSMEEIGRLNGLTMEIQTETSDPGQNSLQQAIADHQELITKLETAMPENRDLQKLVSKSVSKLKDINAEAQKFTK